MNGEYEMDWACGWYDSFHQALYDGDVKLPDVIKLYKEKKITPYQYRFATDYLTLKEE